MQPSQPSLPPELTVRPRQIWRARPGSWADDIPNGFVVAFVCLGIAGALIILDNLALKACGVNQQARITGVSPPMSAARGGMVFEVSFVYRLGDVQVPARCTVNPNSLEALGLPWGPWTPPARAPQTLTVRTLYWGPWHDAVPLPPPASWPYDRITVCLGGVLLIVLACVGTVASVYGRRVREAYRSGDAISGVVWRKRMLPDRSLRPQLEGRWLYVLDCRFTLSRAQTCEVTQRVDVEEWRRAVEGQAVTLLCPRGRRWPRVVYEYGTYSCRDPVTAESKA